MKDLLKRLEWSGTTEGQGHNMGDPGPKVACCPDCRGICPLSPYARHFMKEARGHRDDCILAKILGGATDEELENVYITDNAGDLVDALSDCVNDFPSGIILNDVEGGKVWLKKLNEITNNLLNA